MKYPYIGKGKGVSFRVVVFDSEKCGSVISGEGMVYSKGDHSDSWTEESFTNITREYLEGKCVKIESPEHSEFVQKLAFNAGFIWADGDDRITKMSVGSYLNFRLEIGLTYSSCVDYEEITIPLPPKAEPEPKEWPVVGDTVTWGLESFTAELLATHQNKAWVSNELGNYYIVDVDELKKPKTEAEILRDEVYHVILNRGDSSIAASTATNDLLEQFNITKKPQ